MTERPPVVVSVDEDGVARVDVSIAPEPDPDDLVATNESEPPPGMREGEYQESFTRRWLGA